MLVPELEQWLWFCEGAIASYCSITPDQLRAWMQDRADKLSLPVAKLIEAQPKELFEYIMRDRLRRTISPRDFEEIGKRASVTSLQKCDSFASIVRTLHGWFPR
ncbi:MULTISPECIES: hypothetical protein [unclassified Thiocapsa]|uniref:hypothetical protein n=1 Tax=unclassified Thiocapsa TaxID=2641286 RepID=UPI0035B456B3